MKPEYDPTVFSQLLSGLAHEISNCSQSILLIGQLFKEFWVDVEGVLVNHARLAGDFLAGGIPFTSLQQDMPDYLSSVVDNASKIDSMILELKSMFRPPEARHPQSVDLNTIARSVQILTAHMLKQAGFLLDLQTAERLPRVEVRAQDLVFGLSSLIQRFCQTGPREQRRLALRTRLDAQEPAVHCQLLLPAGAGLAEQLVGEPERELFARNAGRLEVRQSGQSLQLTLSFPLSSSQERNDGH